MIPESLAPNLQRRIKQQLEPAFGRGWQTVLDDRPADSFTAAAACHWPAPPPELQPMHNPALMQHFWNRLLALVDAPVQTVQLAPGWRAVQLNGCAIYVQDANWQTRLLLWQRRRCLEIGLFQVLENYVIVTEIPYRLQWLQYLEQLALTDIRQFYRQQGLRPSSDSITRYGHWMFGQFARALPGAVDLRRMRQRCVQGLQLPPDLLQAAHRIHMINKVSGKVTLVDFNLAVRHAPAMAQLRRDAPALLTLFSVLCDLPGFPAEGEPLSRIRQQLRTMALSGYVWHLLLKANPRLLLLLREFYSRTCVESVRDYLSILERLQVKPDDPPGVVRLLFSEFGHSNSRRTSYWPCLQAHQAAFAHLLSALRTARAEYARAASALPTEEQMALVMRWINSNGISGWNRTQRQRGWSWLLASAQAWQSLELRKQRASPVDWPVPFDTEVWGGLILRTLANATDLIGHGYAMRNCVAICASECRSGAVLLVEVSRPDGKRLATVSYRVRDGAWKLFDAKGPANRELNQTLLRPLYHFAEHIPVTGESVAVRLLA